MRRARQTAQAQREATARAATANRERIAAEAARKAEAARAEAVRQRQVDAIASQLGPGKREAAERLQRMNEQTAALRPKPIRQCTSRTFAQPMSTSYTSRQQAIDYLSSRVQMKIGCNITGSESVLTMTAGAPECAQRTIGGRSQWTCKVTALCVAERCGTDEAPKASNQ